MKVVYMFPLVLALLSLVLQIVGLATPGWIKMNVRIPHVIEYEISMGLWVVNYCINGECGSKGIREFCDRFFTVTTINIDSTLDEYRAETISGVVLIFVTSLCLLRLISCRASDSHKNNIVLLVVSSFCSASSAFLALIASSKWGKDVADAHRQLGINSPYTVPYSPFITGTAGIAAAGLFVILAIAAYREYQASRTSEGYVASRTINQPEHDITVTKNNGTSSSQPYTIQSNTSQGYAVPSSNGTMTTPQYCMCHSYNVQYNATHGCNAQPSNVLPRNQNQNMYSSVTIIEP